MENDIARLQCFDRLAALAGTDEPAKQSNNAGSAWGVEIKTDPLTDATTVVLFRAAEGDVAALLLRCANKNTNVYINWGDYLGSEAIVTSRLGSQKAERKKWSMSNTKTSTFWPGNEAKFVKELMAVDKLVAQVTPYNENPVTAIFDLQGLGEAVKPLLETCDIK